MKALRSPGYEFGPYRLDTVGRSLECRGEVIALPPKAVEVLAELVKRPGEVVGKKELLETVWPEAFVEEANLNQMVFVLRRAIESTNGSEYITTVPRRGYRFSGTVRRVEIPCRIDSIAVLPLANLSGDQRQEYFADGITEALITELAKVGSLRVVSRTSVMRYKGKTEPIAQIARVPWAVNQVYWRARPVFDELIKTGERLRRAQIAALEGRSTDIRAATDAHRLAVVDAVRKAEQIAAAEGVHPASDALTRTLEAVSLAPTGDEPPGRLTKALQPAGFEALSGVRVAPKTAEKLEARKQAEEAAAASRKQEVAVRKKHEAEVKKAEAALERARRRMREAEAALKQTRGE